MKKNCSYSVLISLLAFSMGFLPLFAKHSEDFLLGVYSHLRNNLKVNHTDREAICGKLETLGYNSTIIQTAVDDPDLCGLLNELDRCGIDAWIIDRRWYQDSPGDYKYSITPVSTSNYMRFEAEFSNENDVREGDALDSRYWYASRNDNLFKRVGQAKTAWDASYGHVWEVNMGNDKAGYLFTDLRYRWPNVNGAYVRFGSEFQLYQTTPPSYEREYLWISFRFRITELMPGLDPQEALLTFSVAGYQLSGKGFSSQAHALSHTQQGQEEKRTETVFQVQDFLDSPARSSFIDLKLRVPYADLLDSGLLTADLDNDPSTAPSIETLKLININPRVFWHGNCDLQLDYVEIEDQTHHDLVSDPEFWCLKLKERMNLLIAAGPGNVSGFYTFDEPRQGQFDSYGIIQDIASEAGSSIFTANYDYQISNYVLKGHEDFHYDHIGAFCKTAQPEILATDIYPITPSIDWNSRNGDSRNAFIQDEIDEKLLPVYHDGKQYCLQEDGRSFYPIIQVFGNWIKAGGREQWTKWQLPPAATQKSWLYLPLCYGPDGIIHYRLRAFQNREGHGNRGILISRQGDKDYPLPSVNPVTWPAVSSTNHRVKEYGKIVKNLDWLGSESIGTRASKGGAWLDAALVSSIEVEKRGNGEYEGYVQCGCFLDGEDIPHFMFVNRRGNYFAPGSIKQARYVPDSEYGRYFPEADPQTLEIKFSAETKDLLGDNLALYDPVEKKLHVADGRKLEVSLPAGEGRFYQLVGSLPEDVWWRHKIRGKTILTGDIELKWLSRVTQEAGSELILTPGTTLTVRNGAKLTLNGALVLQGDSRIVVKGKMVDNTASVKKTQESSIVYLD